jgi:hypothetical protein
MKNLVSCFSIFHAYVAKIESEKNEIEMECDLGRKKHPLYLSTTLLFFLARG